MSNHHTIKKGKTEPSQERSLEIFTFKGKEDFLNEEKYPMMDLPNDESVNIFSLADAYAVRTQKDGRVRHYVKRGSHGKLFNPIGMYSEGTQHKQHRHAGKPAWEFKETSQKIFTYYINFLRSKNTAWLNNAEREV